MQKIYQKEIPNWEKNNMITSPNKHSLPVVGLSMANRAAVGAVRVGDELHLVRDPDNQWDKNAIEVTNQIGRIGYIAKGWAIIFAQKMDLGMTFTAIVEQIEPKVIKIQVTREKIEEDIIFDFFKS